MTIPQCKQFLKQHGIENPEMRNWIAHGVSPKRRTKSYLRTVAEHINKQWPSIRSHLHALSLESSPAFRRRVRTATRQFSQSTEAYGYFDWIYGMIKRDNEQSLSFLS